MVSATIIERNFQIPILSSIFVQDRRNTELFVNPISLQHATKEPIQQFDNARSFSGVAAKDSAWINQRIQVGREVCISYNSIRNQRTSNEIPFGAPLFRETMTMFECRLTQAKEVRREKTEKRKRSKK